MPQYSALVPVRRISPGGDGYHFFYGYYDNLAFDAHVRRHLCHRVRFMDRLPVPTDICELGLIDLDTGRFSVFSETHAWNWQQGSMLEWNPAALDEVVYNVFREGHYRCVIHNVVSGREHEVGPALADISPNGRYGLAVSFSRIYDFRPGYGYSQVRDPWYAVPAPADDGIWLVDLASGVTRLLISYEHLAEVFNTDASSRGSKIVVNHLTFNRTSDRFIFLLRTFPKPGAGWKTALGTADLDGNIYPLSGYTFASHYCWQDDRHLFIYADCGAGPGLYQLTDLSHEAVVLDRTFFKQDIHCSCSPDGRYILGDGYPDGDGYRSIYLYNIQTEHGIELGRFYSMPPTVIDIRCDLHARWSCDGQLLSFDSTHEGFRGVYLMELGPLLKTLS